jgi:hypothetical protein
MWNKQEPVINTKEVAELKHEHELKVKELQSDHKLALKEKEFELRHFKDDEVKKLSKDISIKDQRIAVLEKENQMLEKITNLNADIIDIKDLVASLIKKLPEINLQNLTINGSNNI